MLTSTVAYFWKLVSLGRIYLDRETMPLPRYFKRIYATWVTCLLLIVLVIYAMFFLGIFPVRANLLILVLLTALFFTPPIAIVVQLKPKELYPIMIKLVIFMFGGIVILVLSILYFIFAVYFMPNTEDNIIGFPMWTLMFSVVFAILSVLFIRSLMGVGGDRSLVELFSTKIVVWLFIVSISISILSTLYLVTGIDFRSFAFALLPLLWLPLLRRLPEFHSDILETDNMVRPSCTNMDSHPTVIFLRSLSN